MRTDEAEAKPRTQSFAGGGVGWRLRAASEGIGMAMTTSVARTLRTPIVAGVGIVVSGVLVAMVTGKLVADGSTRLLSVLVMLVLAPIFAQLGYSAILSLLLAVSAFPLYMQGLHLSLTVPLVAAVWIAYLAAGQHTGRGKNVASYAFPVAAVLVTSLVALARGSTDRTMPDVGALGRLTVGLALFTACLVMIRSESDVRHAFGAICAGGALIFAMTLLQLISPGLHFPGLLSRVGSVQTNLYGVASNLRLGGPIGDYELLAEFFALVGTIGLFIGLRTKGHEAWRWLACFPIAVVGIAATSTRSGLVVLALGAFAALVVGRRRSTRGRLLPLVALVVICVPVLGTLKSHFGTGYLFERVDSTPLHRGLLGFIDRGSVWPYVLGRLPHGADLFFGRGMAFDYPAFGTWPHSLPLTLVASVGILGAISFYSLLAVIGLRCWRAWRLARNIYALLGALVVALFAFNELKIEYLRDFNYQWFIWGLLGVCASAARISALPGLADE